ncbi:hypothetical protein K438DRAFT_1989168 [Mycena galopus ATCC 62051]|nr:hypothetical protein K438DRAFT_1989168 [Mycena galopus ATCC 62051]
MTARAHPLSHRARTLRAIGRPHQLRVLRLCTDSAGSRCAPAIRRRAASASDFTIANAPTPTTHARYPNSAPDSPSHTNRHASRSTSRRCGTVRVAQGELAVDYVRVRTRAAIPTDYPHWRESARSQRWSLRLRARCARRLEGCWACAGTRPAVAMCSANTR